MFRRIMNPLFTIFIFVIVFVPVISVHAGPGCKYLTGDPGYFPDETIISGGMERNYFYMCLLSTKTIDPPRLFSISTDWEGMLYRS
jgi:hypothetical protein